MRGRDTVYRLRCNNFAVASFRVPCVGLVLCAGLAEEGGLPTAPKLAVYVNLLSQLVLDKEVIHP
jgi:hypothetical protein